jgi:hypothetical protein
MCIGLAALSAFAQNTPSPKAQPKKAMSKVQKPAADAPKPEWMSISIVRVKPDMVTEWQDLQKSVVNPGLKKAGLKERSVFATAVFGESFEYVILSPITSLSQYDEPMAPLRKALGEEAYGDYLTKVRRCIASSHTFGAMTRPDLSYFGKMAAMTGPPKLVVVNSISVLPGRAAAFESFIKSDILPVMKKADVLGYFVSQTMFGGDVNEYTTVIFENSFADIGKGTPLLRVLGQDGAARLAAKTAGLFSRHERSIARYIPELSFAPAP